MIDVCSDGVTHIPECFLSYWHLTMFENREATVRRGVWVYPSHVSVTMHVVRFKLSQSELPIRSRPR